MERAVNLHFTDKTTGDGNGNDVNDSGKLWIGNYVMVVAVTVMMKMVTKMKGDGYEYD